MRFKIGMPGGLVLRVVVNEGGMCVEAQGERLRALRQIYHDDWRMMRRWLEGEGYIVTGLDDGEPWGGEEWSEAG